MWIFYCCPTGGYESVVAAGIHIGMMPLDRVPLEDEISSLPYFGVRHHLLGRPIRFGVDTLGNEVFIIGIGREKGLVSKIIPSFFEINELCPTKVKVVEIAAVKANVVMDLFFPNLQFDNRRMIKKIWKKYSNIVQIVKEVWDQIN
ncbi:MAG: DUF3189 family protein [Bacillota bacterium]